jgi:hypothetical protein
LLGFLQIYWAKIRHQGAVTGGLYTVVRHPQYVGLAIVGLGTLLLWPRFLVLMMYSTMLFLYYFLARWEEEQCLHKFGQSYRDYQERTGMFFPRRLFRQKIPPLLPSAGGKRIAAVLALYVVAMAVTILLGYGLRAYSLSQLSTLYADDMAVIATAVLTGEELRTALRVAMENSQIQTTLQNAGYGHDATLLVYVVPIEWALPDLPMEAAHNGHRGHHTATHFDRRLYKVLFTKARTHMRGIQEEEIIKKTYGRDPLVLVKVNIETAQITGIETPPPHVRWGDIPTPLF